MHANAVIGSNKSAGLPYQKTAGLYPDRALDGTKSMTEYEPEDDNVCPTCGKVLKNRYGRNIHHKQVHGESIAGIEVECSNCGTMIRRRPYNLERSENLFCSPDCRGEWHSGNMEGTNNPRWNGGPVQIPCTWCGSPILEKLAIADRHETHFCDKECRAEWQSANLVGESNPCWRGGSVIDPCDNCGAPVERKRAVAEHRDKAFCDFDCRGEWRSKHYFGENNPNWKGGYRHVEYGEGWNETTRERIREQQNRRCAGCGVAESELARKLPVHHIRPARLFDSPEERNAESNLVALCPSCHIKWEGLPIRPELV